MVMMPPAIVMATTSTPAIVMPASAVMAPAMTSAMMAALDLDDGVIRHAQRITRCNGHCRCGEVWCERNGAGGKSDKHKPLHETISSCELALSRQTGKCRGALRVPGFDSATTQEAAGDRSPLSGLSSALALQRLFGERERPAEASGATSASGRPEYRCGQAGDALWITADPEFSPRHIAKTWFQRLARQDGHAKVRAQTDRQSIAFRSPQVRRGIP